MDDEMIQFKEVTKEFNGRLVLDNVNLDIPEKKITGIIGASGEGKTTILKLMIGFYKPNKGKIHFLRRNISSDMNNIKKHFGFSTEDGSFYDKLTVQENLFHFGKLYNMKNIEIKKRTAELAAMVGLSQAINTLAKNLSMGMKKRLDV